MNFYKPKYLTKGKVIKTVLIGAVVGLVLGMATVLLTKHAPLDGQFVGARVLDVVQEIVEEPLVVEPVCNLLAKVEEGKTLLSSSDILKFKQTGRTLSEYEISLAILDTETCILSENRYWLHADEIKKANRIRSLYIPNTTYLPRFYAVDGDDEIAIMALWWNTFNSDLIAMRKEKEYDDRYVVVANKFLFENKTLVYPEEQTGSSYSDIVYAPYGGTVHNFEIIQSGKDFMNVHVATAFRLLREYDVQSRAYPGRLVVDTMTEAFVKNLFLTEHTDPTLMAATKDSDGGLYLAERVFARLGLNGEKTFRYTYSKTGALGLGQIMPATYNSIVRGYPEAKLIRDTDQGRVDVTNAIIASILVLDDHFSSVRRRAAGSTKTQRILDAKDELEIEEIRAAIYNGGASKYQTQTGKISTRVRETVRFLEKFRMLRALGLFEDYVNTR